MRKMLITIVTLLCLCAVVNAQEYLRIPKGGLPVGRDSALDECILNIDAFPNGFYWADLEGHSWWVLPNPIRRVGDTQLLQVNAYLHYDVRGLARQEGWPVFSSLDEYLATPAPSEAHPPVFLQSDKPAKNPCR